MSFFAHLVILSATKDLRLCEKASRASGSEPSQHDADHGESDPSFFAALEQFVLLGQAPPGREPSEIEHLPIYKTP
jgi:hypothetical protein